MMLNYFFKDNLEREELKRIHRKDIEEFFVENFLFNPKKLEIHVSHKYFNEQNAVQINQRIKEEKDLKLRKISSIDLFKETEEYFPSYY